MSELKERIPKTFCNANYEPVVVSNVGELKAALSQLPDDVNLDFASRVIVYNANTKTEFMDLEEYDED